MTESCKVKSETLHLLWILVSNHLDLGLEAKYRSAM